MKSKFLLFALLIANFVSFAQSTRVAILDFENISGIAKYDGLGKAMSSMLISDIEANVSPKRLQLVERAQIQKILKEQNFQANGKVNKSTAVQTGKLLGVNYLLVGDVYILNDQLIINARLTNTETGDIVFSKKQEGKIVSWLNLKTNIAKEFATSLSQPFYEPMMPDRETPVAIISTYGNAINAKDNGDTSKAENLVETVKEFIPEFKYIEDLAIQINELKEEMNQLTKTVNVLSSEPLKMTSDFILQNDFKSALLVINSAAKNLRTEDPYRFNKKIYLLNKKVEILIYLNKFTEAQEIVDSIKDIEPLFINGIITRLKLYSSTKNYDLINQEYYRIIQNKEIFFSKTLKESSKLNYSMRGWGYSAESGYKNDENSGEEFYQYFEFSNIILELMLFNNVEREIIMPWFEKSLNDITADERVLNYLITIKPFHFMKLNSNLLWAAGIYKVKIPEQYLKLCDLFANKYLFNDTINYKKLLQTHGWKSRDPYFQDENYKIAFRKNWDFLNFRLNIAHAYLLIGNQNYAYSKYCELINEYDKEYIVDESQFYNNYTIVIENDWKELKLRPNLKFTNCSGK